jgi:CRP/FNR family transcriptional regulator
MATTLPAPNLSCCDRYHPPFEGLKRGTPTRCYAPGALLFHEGAGARGVYLLANGRVRLTVGSSAGKMLILGTARPGELLGASACLAGQAHATNAQALTACEARFLAREDFLRLAQSDHAFCLALTRSLSEGLHDACRGLSLLGLSRSAESRLAGVLLRMLEERGGARPASAELRLTHEAMSQMIDSSRETVSRVLSRLRRAGAIRTVGTRLTVCDPAYLRRLANGERGSGSVLRGTKELAAIDAQDLAGHALAGRPA